MASHSTPSKRASDAAAAAKWAEQAREHLSSDRYEEALKCIRTALLYDSNVTGLWKTLATITPDPLERKRALEAIERIRSAPPAPAIAEAPKPAQPAVITPNPRATRLKKGELNMVVGVAIAVVFGIAYLFSVFNPEPKPTIRAIPAYVTATPYHLPSTKGSGSGGGSICNDGTYSSSRGSGTCSHHGGVRK